MQLIKIIYDYQHEFMGGETFCTKFKIESKFDVEIKMDLVKGNELIPTLKDKPRYYDMIIMHIGRINEAFTEADTCKKILKANGSKTLLIAESAVYPADEREVLQHFDNYTPVIAYINNFEDLLKKYAFIKSK